MKNKQLWWVIFILVLFVSYGLATESGFGQEKTGITGGQVTGGEVLQKTCPVMEGNKIDPKIYTEYRGKRVYFCCPSCKAKFEASPEKYLARLPQFTGIVEKGGHVHEMPGEHEGEQDGGWTLSSLVEPFGLATLTLVLVTACAGFFMRRNPKLLLKWHKRLAYIAVASALCHATLVFLAHKNF